MSEYIEREALEDVLNKRLNFLMAENGEYDHYTSGFDEAVTIVEDFPVADVAPVVHGRWIVWEDSMQFVHYTCSVCGEDVIMAQTGDSVLDLFTYTYCPQCGAKMDERPNQMFEEDNHD